MKEYRDYYSQAMQEAKQDAIVPTELQITIPSSDFDRDVSIASFSLESNDTYTVNLFNMTCSCYDFIKQGRANYAKDDIRRMCKHLMRKYEKDIGLQGVSKFGRYILNHEYSLKKNIRYTNSEKLKHPVIVNFNSTDEWWYIYIRQEKEIDEYSRYGFFPGASGSWYDSKPYGIAGELKLKIKAIQKDIKEQEKQAAKKKQVEAEKLTSEDVRVSLGCFIVFILLVVILFKACG